MSVPMDIPKRATPESSPANSPKSPVLHIPSPVTTRRTRTVSACERALQGPSFKGKVKTFCREKGHGFIIPNEGGDALFVHISDIESEFVLKPGDEVQYKTIKCPPKNDKMQAVHVKIHKPAQGVTHERWEDPFARSPTS